MSLDSVIFKLLLVLQIVLSILFNQLVLDVNRITFWIGFSNVSETLKWSIIVWLIFRILKHWRSNVQNVTWVTFWTGKTTHVKEDNWTQFKTVKSTKLMRMLVRLVNQITSSINMIRLDVTDYLIIVRIILWLMINWLALNATRLFIWITIKTVRVFQPITIV